MMSILLAMLSTSSLRAQVTSLTTKPHTPVLEAEEIINEVSTLKHFMPPCSEQNVASAPPGRALDSTRQTDADSND